MTIDLRSDTVTKPSPEMRRAMADAEVGDDVFGEDPTVNKLQETVAGLLGTEAALFVPTGCMANQIALKIHTRPGDEMLVGKNAHNWLFETGAAAAISGVQPLQIGDDGRFTSDDMREAFKPDNHHQPPTRLVSVENTHNIGGGRLWEQDAVNGVLGTARELSLATHLDGARLWNAAAGSGKSEAELAAGFDTISVCLSKGLGAPVGSLICGSKAHMHEAHRYRKMLGGGMRQAGILAAAGLYALEHNRARLDDDHANAKLMAGGIDAIEGLSVDVSAVQTNIVMIDVEPGFAAAEQLVEQARQADLLCIAMGSARIRLVTHLDVDNAACERAVSIFAEIAQAARTNQ